MSGAAFMLGWESNIQRVLALAFEQDSVDSVTLALSLLRCKK